MMLKIILIIVALIGVVVGVFFYAKYQNVQVPTKIINPISQDPIDPDVLGKNTTSNNNLLDRLKPQNITTKIEQEIINTSDAIINDTKENIRSKAQDTVNSFFEKKQEEVVVNISNSPVEESKILTVDIVKDKNIKLNLIRGNKYYVQFKNLDKNQCVYIQEKMYKLETGQTLEISFNSAGNFPIKTALCNDLDQNIGELVVQ